MLDVVDATSILYRLQLQGRILCGYNHNYFIDNSFTGVPIGAEQWENVYNVCRSHSSDHILAFNDIHFLFAYLGCGKPDVVDQLIATGAEYARFSG